MLLFNSGKFINRTRLAEWAEEKLVIDESKLKDLGVQDPAKIHDAVGELMRE